MSVIITESIVEEAALDWLKGLGYKHLFGPDIACDGSKPERATYSDVVLVERLRAALFSINQTIPADAIEEALKKVLRPDSPSLIVNNRQFHKMLADGVDVEYRNDDGRIVGDKVWLVDFENAKNNDWLAVNQFTVVEGQQNRRPDIVVFINGLPLAVIELKNPADENATIQAAYNQFQTYKKDIASLFNYNELLVLSDGTEARVGTLTSGWEWFLPWKTIGGETEAPVEFAELEVLIKGVFEKARFLDIVRHFIVFEVNGATIIKKAAAYHQYHAVNAAVAATVKATSPKGDKRAGVVWHTQGAGKSLTMVFYAGKIVLHPAMENPTLILLTDRNDLDQQLFDNFAVAQDILRQKPVQAESRKELMKLLKTASGGIIFTTIQKFFPESGEKFSALSDRRNIIVIADEAHRSQYDFIDGFARHIRDALPNASFIGFTGTPIELDDRNTRAVFGNYISIYDIQQAVEDGATVRIYYEGRLAKIDLNEDEKPHIDPDFEEITEGEEETVKQKVKTKWARIEAMVGTEKRLDLVADDIVKHFEQRLEAIDGKGMIVCMSRRICVDLYDAIIKLRPQWQHDDDDKGVLKVVMTGSATDPLSFQSHIRNKVRRESIKKRMKNPDDQLKLVIVRDMWLTGFDAPCLHTMYIDKPMRGHGLMQAIARVNRVFRDKPGGLIVDYLGIAEELKKALANYIEADPDRETVFSQEDAVAIMLEKFEIVSSMFHGFDYSKFFTGTPAERLSVIKPAMQHILVQKDGKERLLQSVTELSKAFALSVPHEDALKIKDDVGFYQAIRAAIAKYTLVQGKSKEELDTAVRQIVSRAVSSDKVIDIFGTVGLKKPDISILSDEFLAEIQGMPHRNLAIEVLQKLLNDEIKTRSKRNLVLSRSFADMLEKTIRKYQNRTIEAAQVILELIGLAKEMREAKSRGAKLGLNDDEEAFYDALGVNDSAVQVLGDETLKTIAKELVEAVRRNVTIDWTVKESVRAKLRTIVKRILRKYGYPPDKQEKATLTVLEQAELLCKDWGT